MPLATIGLAALVMVCTVCGLFYRDRIRTSESLLQQAQGESDRRDFDSSLEHAQGALAGLRWFPWQSGLREQSKNTIAAAERGRAVTALYKLVDEMRFLDNQPVDDRALVKIAEGCNQLWEKRAQFAVPADDRVRNALLDLAILSSRLNLQLANPARLVEARRAARQRLNEATDLCGESPILELYKHGEVVDSASAPAKAEIDMRPRVKTPWEHYAVGRWLMHQGSLVQAEQQFKSALDQQPNDFWLNFQLARCSFELQHFEPALVAASICVALEPSHAECYYNRALCREALSQNDEALADFEHALKLAPDFAAASSARDVLLKKVEK
jgi:tetratricopeptide (TPR) repeat protein